MRGQHRWASILAVAALLALFRHPASAENKGDAQSGWILSHHSFERTLTYDDRLGDWLASAATMALRDRVQILPPVADRYGMFWNKRATNTKDFEVSFLFRPLPQKKGGAEDGMFAFWLSPDNFTASYNEQAIVSTRDWKKGLDEAGLTFLSNRPNFKGLGVLFLGLDQSSQLRPSVTAVLCDGKTELKMSDFPAPQDEKVDRKQTKYIDWRKSSDGSQLIELKIRATLGKELVGTLQVAKAQPPVEIFRLPAEETNSWTESFFGLSGWSGSDSFLELDVTRLETRNFDKTVVGEDKEESKNALDDELIGDAEQWKKLLDEEKRYIDQKSQKEAVERLTKLLGDYIERYNKMGEKVKADLVWLEKRMQSLDAKVGALVGSSKAVNPETGNVEARSLKEHIVGIRSILTKDKDVHDEKISQVHKAAKDLKAKGGDILGAEGRAKVASVAEQARKVEEHVSSGTTFSSLLIVLVFAVCILGALFASRMSYYEKRMSGSSLLPSSHRSA